MSHLKVSQASEDVLVKWDLVLIAQVILWIPEISVSNVSLYLIYRLNDQIKAPKASFIREPFTVSNLIHIKICKNRAAAWPKAPKLTKMVAVQNIRHFFMCYMQQRRNYVARRNKIVVCINRNLEKRKYIFWRY